MISGIAREAAKLETVVAVGDVAAGDLLGEEIIDYERAVAGASPARNFEPRSADDLFIVYTGGTTGMPKGVMWRHEDVFFAGLQGGNPGGTPISRPEELAENYRSGNAMSVTMLPTAPLIHGSAQWTRADLSVYRRKGRAAAGKELRSQARARVDRRGAGRAR